MKISVNEIQIYVFMKEIYERWVKMQDTKLKSALGISTNENVCSFVVITT